MERGLHRPEGKATLCPPQGAWNANVANGNMEQVWRDLSDLQLSLLVSAAVAVAVTVRPRKWEGAREEFSNQSGVGMVLGLDGQIVNQTNLVASRV